MEMTLELLKEGIEKKISCDPDAESICIRLSRNAAEDLLNELDGILNREDDGK